MLQRIAPTLYRAQVGDHVTIFAVAQNNGGAEHANFRYGPSVLTTRPVNGHPGCDFVVQAGVATFGTVVTFSPGSPNARYDLFEDVSGSSSDLQFPIHASFGAVAQFQIDGVPVPVLAAAPKKVAAKKAAAKKAAAKNAAAKKAKKAAKKAAKKTARKTARRKASKKGAKKAAKKRSQTVAKARKTSRNAARKTRRGRRQ